MMNNDDLALSNITEMRVLYLEKEIEKLREYILELEVKLKVNPFTRDSFKDKEINFSEYI